VLSRCHEPDAIFSEILDRQEGSDAEAEETEDIEEFFRARLAELNYDTDRVCVFVPSAVAAEWVRKAVNDRHLKNAAAVRMLRQRITEGAAQNLIEDKARKLGRGFIWSGTFGEGPHVFRDLEERQNQQHRPSFF
jgi:RNA polymerase-interacting CarD/CdnL/TRCF family regulator